MGTYCPVRIYGKDPTSTLLGRRSRLPLLFCRAKKRWLALRPVARVVLSPNEPQSIKGQVFVDLLNMAGFRTDDRASPPVAITLVSDPSSANIFSRMASTIPRAP